MEAGSKVFLVVRTDMLPSIRSSVHAIWCVASVRVMRGHASLRYISRYLGNKVAKDDSSVKVPALLSSGVNVSI